MSEMVVDNNPRCSAPPETSHPVLPKSTSPVLCTLSPESLWPNPLLPWREDAIGIQLILDPVIQPHQRGHTLRPLIVGAKVIDPSHQIHVVDVGSVLAVASTPGLYDQFCKQLIGCRLVFLVCPVKVDH